MISSKNQLKNKIIQIFQPQQNFTIALESFAEIRKFIDYKEFDNQNLLFNLINFFIQIIKNLR